MKFCIVLFFLTVVDCLQLKVFKWPDYHDLKWELNLLPAEEKTCITTKYPDSLRVGSLNTDKCLIVYQSLSCDIAEGETLRVDKDTSHFHANWFNNDYIEIGSFHVCSQELGGGPTLDVDFYGEMFFKGNILAKHRNLCGCQNIPKEYTLNNSHVLSLNNYGNGIAVFENENCEHPYFYIPPGGNMMSNTLTTCLRNGYPREIRVRSFCPMTTVKCVR